MTGAPLPPGAVSVVVPVYNAAPYLAACLDSVLAQTRPADEVVCVDDGSTDGSADVLAAYADRVRAVRRPHRGVAPTLNEAVALARGDRLAFLDADDLWAPEKLALQTAALDADPALDACFGHVRQFVSPDLPAAVRAGIACPDGPQAGWLKQTMLVRRAAFDRVGGFDERYHTGDFVAWFVRAREAGLRTRMLPETVAYRRLHRSGLASQAAFGHEFAHILKGALDRRRAASS